MVAEWINDRFRRAMHLRFVAFPSFFSFTTEMTPSIGSKNCAAISISESETTILREDTVTVCPDLGKRRKKRLNSLDSQRQD